MNDKHISFDVQMNVQQIFLKDKKYQYGNTYAFSDDLVSSIFLPIAHSGAISINT